MSTDKVVVTTPRVKKTKKILAWGLSAALTLTIVGPIAVAAVVGWKLIHPARETILTNPAQLGMNYIDVEFISRGDQTKLKGWFISANEQNKKVSTTGNNNENNAESNIEGNGKTIIISHGYGKNRTQDDVPVLPLIQELVNKGYSVLTFDYRNSGESEGEVTSVGEFEKLDLLGAIDWVHANHPSQISILGYSMGAVVAILAAAEEPSVAGLVVDSPFNNFKNYLEDNLSVWSNLPHFPFTPLILKVMPYLSDIELENNNALRSISDVYPRPVLFIHSIEDKAIPYTNSEKMWEKHSDVFQFWKTTKGGHVGSYKEQPEAYTQKVLEFFDSL